MILKGGQALLVELGKNQNVYKLCNIPGVTVRPKRGKDECLGRLGCGFKAVATELFRQVNCRPLFSTFSNLAVQVGRIVLPKIGFHIACTHPVL